MKTKLLITIVITVLFSFPAYADSNQSTAIPALSAWTNQSGSTLHIHNIANNGQLTGTYINRAQGYDCHNISYPVTGWVYGSAITFTTIWRGTTSCNSITAWSGLNYQGVISTLWQLTINGSTSTSQIIQGNDKFKQSASVTKKSPILK